MPSAPPTPSNAADVTPEQLAAALLGSTRHKAPHLSELCEALTSQWGGPDALAKSLHEMYMDPLTNKPTKARIGLAITKLIEANTAQGGDTEDYSTMSDEDLQHLLLHTLAQVPGLMHTLMTMQEEEHLPCPTTHAV